MPEVKHITAPDGVVYHIRDKNLQDFNEKLEEILDTGGDPITSTEHTLAENLLRLQSATEDIADAITEKGGSAAYSDGLEAMADKVRAIPTPQPTLITKTITQNGTYNAADDSADGYSSVSVDVEVYAFLYVTASDGASVTVSKGQTVLPVQTSLGQDLLFKIPESGDWTVSAVKTGETTRSEIVEISENGVFSVDVSFIHIYGVSWDKSSSTALTRTDDAANFSDPEPYYSGMSGTPSSPFDNIMPWKGMVKETIDGNVLVKIPKFWYKITNTDSKLQFQIATGPAEGFSISPAHQARNSNEVDRDYVYVGRYKCSSASASSYKSVSGATPKVSMTRATARTNITGLGSGYYIQDFAMFWTIRMLYLVEFADWNSQAKIGYGCGDGSSVVSTGYTDSMTYHTGTNQSSRTTYGGTQYRWIEGLWDNVYEWIDGIRFSSSTVYVYIDPSTYSDSSGGTSIGSRATSSDYIKGWLVPSNTLDWALYPNSVGGSDSTYVPDRCYYGSSGVVLCVGGSYGQYRDRGLFCLYGNGSASSSGSSIGARLMYLP